MKLLWNAELKLNTVHVDDLCKAIWFVCGRDDTLNEVFNVVDDGNTSQGVVSDLVSELFNISHDYWGNTLSNIVKVKTNYSFGCVQFLMFLLFCFSG